MCCLNTYPRQVRDLQLATSQPMGAAAQCAISGVSSLVIAFLYSWKLTLVITCTVPAVYIFMAFLSTRLARGVVHQTACLQEALNYATNAFQNIETVKCFNGERVELHKFGQSIARAAKYHSRQANLRSIQLGFMQCITLSMFVQGFWYGSSLIAGGKRSPGQVMTTFWAALMAVQSITGFLPQWIILEKGRVAAAHLKAVELQVKDEGRASVFATRQGPRSCSGDIEFKQVSYCFCEPTLYVLIRQRCRSRTLHYRINWPSVKPHCFSPPASSRSLSAEAAQAKVHLVNSP